MSSHNARVSSLLLNAIGQLTEIAGLSDERLVRAVAELSRRFTKERTSFKRSYLQDPVMASAYLNYFLPVNLSKVQVLLDEMPSVGAGEGFSVLDLGSGPGTGALAVLDWWHGRRHRGPLSLMAVDNASAALRQAEQLWGHYCRASEMAGARLRTIEADVEGGAWLEPAKEQGPFDLIILSNCLNELAESIDKRAEIVLSALSMLTPHGTVMIIEPALRETSRALHQVRDQLLKEKRCTVYSPCLHEYGCPAMVHPDDWCHEERAWVPPSSVLEIDEAVGFIKDALKFSYLLLRKDGKTIVERRPDLYRVVSELREMKGDKRAWLCNELGRQEVGRQDRLASPRNAALDHWHRGAIVQIERIVRKEQSGKVSALGRIEQDVTVQMIRPA